MMSAFRLEGLQGAPAPHKVADRRHLRVRVSRWVALAAPCGGHVMSLANASTVQPGFSTGVDALAPGLQMPFAQAPLDE
jgi:hypothetical protein